MHHPTLDEVLKLKEQANLVPVYRDIVADLDTPVSAFLKIARGDYSFLLESVEGGEHIARYSFIGTEPSLVMRPNPGEESDPIPHIEAEMGRFKAAPVAGLPRFHGGMVGYMGYEVVRNFEKLPSPTKDPLGVPPYVLMLADSLVIFDHLTHRMKVVANARLDEAETVEAAYKKAAARVDELVERLKKPLEPQPEAAPTRAAPVSSNISEDEYEHIVRRAKEHIYAGDIIQVVPSQRLAKPTTTNPFAIYRSLRSLNPSPYMYYLHLKDINIVGASPELLVRVEDGMVYSHPIAGTRPRSSDPARDQALADELQRDEKELAEHIMLVDLARNDIGRVSTPGSVRVTELMKVERYSHVMHLVSHVEGRLRPELSSLDALRACFPAGTVSGAPKIRAMEIIAELETDKRGPYAGAVGYVDFCGNMDTAITIRTIVIKDGVAYVQAGGGVVADSVPRREYEESMNKARALIAAIEQTESANAIDH